MDPTIVALIPARAGSKRIPGKNTKLLGGKPLIQWTIEAAKAAGIFRDVLICSDDHETLVQGSWAGALPMLRRAEDCTDEAPDFLWVSDIISRLGIQPDAFAILRPTSPFRSSRLIRQAWLHFQANQPVDSARAVREVREHPGKMWMAQREYRMIPLLPYWTRTGDHATDSPWHSSPTQVLPKVYIQTASLEIAWTSTIARTETIAGSSVLPLGVYDWDAFDINTPDDWEIAEQHAAELASLARLPPLPATE